MPKSLNHRSITQCSITMQHKFILSQCPNQQHHPHVWNKLSSGAHGTATSVQHNGEDDSRATNKSRTNVSSTNASAEMCAHNACPSINKPKSDTVDPNFHNWGYKTSCLKLNLESDNRMTRAESAGGLSRTIGP